MSSKDEAKGRMSRKWHKLRDSVSQRSSSVVKRPQPDLGSSVQQADKHGDEALAIINPAADISGKATATLVNSQSSTAGSYISLWDRACISIHERDSESKHLQRLKDNLGAIPNQDILPTDLLELVDRRQTQIRSKDGVSLSEGRKWMGRLRRLVISTKEPIMRATRFDPSYVSPIVLGGVYTLIQAWQDEGEALMIALNAIMEAAGLVALWTCYEYQQIRRNQNSDLDKLYQELSEQIVKLYMEVIGLLGAMMKFCEDRFWLRFLRNIGSTISSDTREWKAKQEEVQSRRKICENVKDRIKATKDGQELNAKILIAISKYDFRGAYRNVLMKTGVDKRFDDRCAWFIDGENFKNWATMSKNAILLLEGSKGTGKTTVMARAISEILDSDAVQFQGKKFAMFFFQKTEGQPSLLTAKGCLQSLVRQVSWNYTTASVEGATEAMYERFMKQLAGDTEWSTEECLKLLKELIPGNETYIMIDGIDECKDSVGLLQRLSELTISSQKAAGNRQPLHMMLSGRQDLKISTYFTECISISTTPDYSRVDAEYYVKTEIAYRRELRPGSLFFKSSDYTSRLERLLIEQGKGLFRWMEMLIDVFEKRRFETTDDIEDLFGELLQPQDRKEMNEEYSRLFDTLGPTNQRALTKMLKLLACPKLWYDINSPSGLSENYHTLVDLAEAMNASDASKGRANWFAEGISSVLAGFVTIDVTTAAVRIAHASVIDYLTSNSAPEGDFSLEGLHAEAVLLCLSCISYQQDSDFFEYSCNHWSDHCRIAIADSQAPAAQNLKKPVKAFLFSDDWWIWVGTLKEKNTIIVEGIEMPERSIGFFIAYDQLIKLLDPGFDDERPCIRDMINLGDVNKDGQSVLEVAIYHGKVSDVQELLQLLPDQAAVVDTEKCLLAACKRRKHELTRIFLGMGASIFSWSVDGPVFHWMFYYVYNIYSSTVATKKIQDIFIECAQELDARGFLGSLQRLLRMRDLFGGTASELCGKIPVYELELNSLLDKATKRDGQVLYEFGDPDIPLVRRGMVQVSDVKVTLRAHRRNIFRIANCLDVDKEASVEAIEVWWDRREELSEESNEESREESREESNEEAREKKARKDMRMQVWREHRQWVIKRHKELDAQYNAMKQTVEEEKKNQQSN